MVLPLLLRCAPCDDFKKWFLLSWYGSPASNTVYVSETGEVLLSVTWQDLWEEKWWGWPPYLHIKLLATSFQKMRSPGLTIKHRTSRERELEFFFSSYQALGSFTAPFNFSFQHSVNRVNVFSRQYCSQNIILLFSKTIAYMFKSRLCYFTSLFQRWNKSSFLIQNNTMFLKSYCWSMLRQNIM